MKNVKKCWSIYIKTMEYDPLFAVSDEGDIWIHGKLIRTDEHAAKELNKRFLSWASVPRTPVDNVFGMRLVIDEFLESKNDDAVEDIAKELWDTTQRSGFETTPEIEPLSFDRISGATKETLRRQARGLLNGRVGDLIYRAKKAEAGVDEG